MRTMSSADHYRDKTLGPWSSHPYWARRRDRYFAFAAFLPLGLAIALAVLVASDFQNWVSMIRDRTAWLTVLAATATFGIAAVMSVSLCGRISVWQSRRRVHDSATRWLHP